MLHRASQSADDLFTKASVGLDLTARQFVVLSVVAEEVDPSQTVIGEKSGIDRSTLADIVGRLVARGLLSRRRTHSDARKYAVKLTEAGRKCLEQAIPAAIEVERQLMGGLSPGERAGLDSLLATMSARVEQKPY
jgi:DNA-binding MarR family transcriptional regulator